VSESFVALWAEDFRVHVVFGFPSAVFPWSRREVGSKEAVDETFLKMDLDRPLRRGGYCIWWRI